jgi:hypothetical protein
METDSTLLVCSVVLFAPSTLLGTTDVLEIASDSCSSKTHLLPGRAPLVAALESLRVLPVQLSCFLVVTTFNGTNLSALTASSYPMNPALLSPGPFSAARKECMYTTVHISSRAEGVGSPENVRMNPTRWIGQIRGCGPLNRARRSAAAILGFALQSSLLYGTAQRYRTNWTNILQGKQEPHADLGTLRSLSLNVELQLQNRAGT